MSSLSLYNKLESSKVLVGNSFNVARLITVMKFLIT